MNRISHSAIVRAIVCLLMILCLTGCGAGNPFNSALGGNPSGSSGGGGGGGNGGGGGAGGQITDAARAQVIADVNTKIASLSTIDPSKRRQAMLDYFKSRKEFATSGLGPDGLDIWARFTDGRLFVIIANRDPGRAAAIPFAPTRSAGAELPTSIRACVLLCRKPYSDNPVPDVQSMLTAHDYTQPIGGDGTIDGLKQVSGDGVVCIFAHGGWAVSKSGADTLCVTSATPQSETADAALKVDLDKERVVYATVADPNLILPGTHDDTYYGFTWQFVDQYMSFGANSFVYLGCCHGTDPLDPLFYQTFLKKGAGVVAGWTAPVLAIDEAKVSRFLFDRLLGANKFDPKEDPPQRPFDYAAIKADMAKRGLDRSGSAELLFKYNSASQFGLLAPSIQHMDVDDKAKMLKIHGIFGADPGTSDGQVSIGGQLMGSRTWSNNEIDVNNLPVSGAGSSGDVTVSVRRHKSNVVQLTDWKGDFTYTFSAIGSLQVTGPITLHFRADVHEFRDSPHVTPTKPVVNFTATSDSKAHWTASGSGTLNNAKATWSGQTDISLDGSTGAGNILQCFGNIDTDSKVLNMALLAATTTGLKFQMTAPGAPPAHGDLAAATGKLDGNLSSTQPIPALHVPLANDFTIPAGERKESVKDGTLLLKWSNIKPTSPPDPDAAR